MTKTTTVALRYDLTEQGRIGVTAMRPIVETVLAELEKTRAPEECSAAGLALVIIALWEEAQLRRVIHGPQ